MGNLKLGKLYFAFLALPFCIQSAWSQTPAPAPAPATAPAQNPYARELTPGEIMESCDKYQDNPQRYQQCLSLANRGNNKDNAHDCDTLRDKLNEAISKLGTACGRVGMNSDANDCADQIRSCTTKTGGKDEESDSPACPSLGADAQKFLKDTQKAQEDLDKLKTDIGNINDKIAEANQSSQEKISNLQDKMAKANSELTKAQALMTKDLNKRISEAQKQTAVQIQQMQEQVDKISIDMKGIPVQKSAARIKTYDEPVTNLRLTCHQEAIKRVSDKHDEIMKKIGNSQYNIGGLAAMVNQMGMTDYQRDQALARRYELECLNDSGYKMQVRMAYEGYRNALRELDRQQEGMQLQQSQILKRIDTTQQQAHLDQNQAYTDANTDLQAARQTYVTDMQSMQKQLGDAQNSAQVKIDALKSQQALKQSTIDQKQEFLNTQMALARKKESASHGSDYTTTDSNNLDSAFSDAKKAASGVAASCNCGHDGEDTLACPVAKEFYKAAMGNDLPVSNPVASNPNPKPSPRGGSETASSQETDPSRDPGSISSPDSPDDPRGIQEGSYSNGGAY